MQASGGQPARRGYGQYCAVAGALDVVGERWTLLIVRDLLMGPKRYTDLREGLPGIATDLLTARLRTLEAAGLVRRRALPRPAPATVYELTERGQLLGPVVGALARVGFSFLGEPTDDTEIPAERLVLSLHAMFRPAAAAGLAATYQLQLGEDETFVVAVAEAEVQASRGVAADPDATISTDPLTLARLLGRRSDPDEAEAAGALVLDGSHSAFERFMATFAWSAAPAASPDS